MPLRDELKRRELLGLVRDLALSRHVTLEELEHRGRSSRRVSRARWEVWAEMRRRGFSYSEIARVWGVHHTSVMHGIRRV
jgi:SOS response regulatory protein OraA/RecX